MAYFVKSSVPPQFSPTVSSQGSWSTMKFKHCMKINSLPKCISGSFGINKEQIKVFKELKEHFWRKSVLYQTIKTKERLCHSCKSTGILPFEMVNLYRTRWCFALMWGEYQYLHVHGSTIWRQTDDWLDPISPASAHHAHARQERYRLTWHWTVREGRGGRKTDIKGDIRVGGIFVTREDFTKPLTTNYSLPFDKSVVNHRQRCIASLLCIRAGTKEERLHAPNGV